MIDDRENLKTIIISVIFKIKSRLSLEAGRRVALVGGKSNSKELIRVANIFLAFSPSACICWFVRPAEAALLLCVELLAQENTPVVTLQRGVESLLHSDDLRGKPRASAIQGPRDPAFLTTPLLLSLPAGIIWGYCVMKKRRGSFQCEALITE